MKIVKAVIVVALLIGLGLVVGGFVELHRGHSGPKVSATVSECHHVSGLHGGSTTCTGSWIVGGSLLAGGHVVVGTIDGVGYGEVGKNVAARVHGGSANTASLKTPIAMFAVGGGTALFGLWFLWALVTGRADGSRRSATRGSRGASESDSGGAASTASSPRSGGSAPG